MTKNVTMAPQGRHIRRHRGARYRPLSAPKSRRAFDRRYVLHNALDESVIINDNGVRLSA
jgi:hypothetical protein